MNRIGPVLLSVLIALADGPAVAEEGDYALVIHGGAGTITRENMTPETEAAYRDALVSALRAGQSVLASGGSALDAVVASILPLEDSPLFNAGRGAVFTHDGRNELDAAIMDGATLNAGAVAGVTRVRNPVLLARAVMEKSHHVLLMGAGAEEFAREAGLTLVSPTWFFTERRYKQLLAIQEKQDHAALAWPGDHRFGTVGAVAYDSSGHIAAATSTGGLTDKRWGRIGDSPIIGAGTYAKDDSCGVSGTGTGEYFIRATVAREICALIEYKGMTVKAAADELIQVRLKAMGGDGGVIAIGPEGEIAWSFNTEGMYRGSVSSAAPDPVIGIYED